jgi:hypothetical protein
MNRTTTRFGLLVGTGTPVALTLGGCIYSSPEKERVVTAPAPPVVAQSTDVAYPNGRWQLYGDGTTSSPHYWVWVPAGSTPPPPPRLPRR